MRFLLIDAVVIAVALGFALVARRALKRRAQAEREKREAEEKVEVWVEAERERQADPEAKVNRRSSAWRRN